MTATPGYRFWIDEKGTPGYYLLRDNQDLSRDHIIARYTDEREAYEALERLNQYDAWEKRQHRAARTERRWLEGLDTSTR